MKTFAKAAVLLIAVGLLAACSSASKRPRHKLYLNEQDYLDDLGPSVQLERREAPAMVESDYIFNVVPETDKGVYIFDNRQQPKIPGEYRDADYRKEKRLWTKPKRYTPEQYYGMQGGGEAEASSSEMPYGY